MTGRARLAALLYWVAGTAYFLDRVTKVLAERYLAQAGPIRLIPNVLHLTFTTNAGGAFGLFGGQPWLFFTATALVALAIVASSFRLREGVSSVGLGLVLGGALGNLTDRVLRGPSASGRVVDFIDFRVWPVFNLADSAIVIGAAIVVLVSLRQRA